MTTPITLTIAGSDSGGGAGIQADIKAISATGGYACSVITALTAQNTRGVNAVMPVPADFVGRQLDSVFGDLAVIAVKIGMLADKDVIATVAAKLRQYQPAHIVLDPVMVATSGDRLLAADAIDSLKQQLLPLADIITPNLPEAAAILGGNEPCTDAELQTFILRLQQYCGDQHCGHILLKGGHLTSSQQSCDWLIGPQQIQCFEAKRINTRNTHGTGCTLSAAIASFLAQGQTMTAAVASAKHYLTGALQAADKLQIGTGHGPVNHFFRQDTCQ